MAPAFLSAKAAAAKRGLFGRSGKSGRDLAANEDANPNDAKNEDSNEAPKGESAEESRRKELLEVMKDRSLSKEEKSRRMEEVKRKYDKNGPANATAKSTPAAASMAPADGGRDDDEKSRPQSPPFHPPKGGMDLSAKAAAHKSKREVKSLFNRMSGRNVMISSKESYEKQLVLDKPAEKEPVKPKPPSLDAQRRAEIQLVMKDKSLEKEERRRRIGEINEKYAVLSEEQGGDGGGGGEGGEETKNGGNKHVGIDLSAKSYAEKHLKELETMPVKSLKERMAAYENESTVVAGKEYEQHIKERDHRDKSSLGLHAKHRTKLGVTVDPTSFALAQNGLYGVQRSKKKSVSSEYGGRF